MTPLEHQIAEVIAQHPEYHAILKNPESLDQDYLPEMGQVNPFLHLSLHLSVQDQLRLDRPQGIQSLFKTLAQRHQDEHSAEHLLIECLAEEIFQATRSGIPPSEEAYFLRLRQLN